MNDTIYRQEAIEAMEGLPKYFDKTDTLCLDYADVLAVLSEHLPSTQPEPKKGTWVDYSEDGFVECPFCGSATNCDGNKEELHFCFSCGADMRGEKNEDSN